jgi:uncharacterized membrane protein YqjE
MGETAESGRTGTWGGSLRQFGDSLLGLLQTRVEILALEWAEERGNLTRLLLGVFAILACLHLAIVVGLVFVLLVVGEEHRVAVIGVAALVLLLAAAGGALGLRAWLKRRRPMFGTTIAELRKDREWIRGRS